MAEPTPFVLPPKRLVIAERGQRCYVCDKRIKRGDVIQLIVHGWGHPRCAQEKRAHLVATGQAVPPPPPWWQFWKKGANRG